jgi:hypothetical protein
VDKSTKIIEGKLVPYGRAFLGCGNLNITKNPHPTNKEKASPKRWLLYIFIVDVPTII